jgi:hypothetical protein
VRWLVAGFVALITACGPIATAPRTASPTPELASPSTGFVLPIGTTKCVIAHVGSNATLKISGHDVEGLCQSWLDIRAGDGQAPYFLATDSILPVVCHYVDNTSNEDYIVQGFSGEWLPDDFCSWLHQWSLDPAHGQAPRDWEP